MKDIEATDSGAFAYDIGEQIDVMTRAVIIERSESADGRTYLVKAMKSDGRETFFRASEEDVYEADTTLENA